jgi:hypothetical protein
MSEPVFCAGKSNLGTPTLKVVKCPRCGGDIELFSTDAKAACYNCGFVAYNDINLCVQWCKHAEECVGTEMYNRMVSEGLIKK